MFGHINLYLVILVLIYIQEWSAGLITDQKWWYIPSHLTSGEHWSNHFIIWHFRQNVYLMLKVIIAKFSSVQFSHSVVSDSLWPHEPQHARPPCPSSTARVYPNPCPLSQWCHPTISSSVVHFSFCPQSFPASGSFQMSQFFTSGGQTIGVSASPSVLPINIQDWSPLGWTGWIFLQSKGLWRVISNTTVQKHQFFGAQLS